ncbi:trypsin-like serine protease [Escherichia coli]|nr:trypsin-like serine protease [Escherichia coli]
MKPLPLLVFGLGLSAAVAGGWAYSIERAAAGQLAQARAVIGAREVRSEEITLQSYHPAPGDVPARAARQGDPADAIERVMRSTVKIETVYQPRARLALLAFPGQRETWFRRLFTSAPPDAGELGGFAAGVIVAPGVVLTAAHALPKDRSVTFRVTLADGRTFDTQAVAYSPQYDAATLHIADRSTPAVPFARELPRAGESVAAIGHPRGLQWASTVGTMSAVRDMLARDGSGEVTQIETDLRTQPGNSGGPVINAAGELVGIETHTFRGASYAMPAAAAYASIAQQGESKFQCYKAI